MDRILINFPTNIGDTILSLPVLDRMKASYPKSKITAIVSANTKNLLIRSNFIDEIVVFDKLWGWRQKMMFSLDLRGKYDIIVDLKNSFLPVVTAAKRRTPFIRKYQKGVHMKDIYLRLIDKLSYNTYWERGDFILDVERVSYWDNLKLSPSVFIACSSRSHIKRYPQSYLKRVIETLSKSGLPLVILGEERDRDYYKGVSGLSGVYNLVEKTDMADVYFLLKKYARLLLCVDSSILHFGSYFNLPIVSLFGPTNSVRYGPWSKDFVILKNKEVGCSSSGSLPDSFDALCMDISADIVVKAVIDMMARLPLKNETIQKYIGG